MEPEQDAPPGDDGAEGLLSELEARVQDVVKASSWWERQGLDCTILALSFLALPAGFLCLRSENILLFAAGIVILGVCHYTLTVKGSHLATHGALTESKRWSKIWALFFVEVCTSFTAEYATYGHVKMHHGYTNVVGLGDSSTWKLPCLNRYVYMFLAPFLLPIVTPLVAVGHKQAAGLEVEQLTPKPASVLSSRDVALIPIHLLI